MKVLRQLSRVVAAFGVGQALRARDLLMLLPGPSDLPLLRVAVDARPSEEAKAAFAARYPSATTLPEPTNLNRDYGRRSVDAAIGLIAARGIYLAAAPFRHRAAQECVRTSVETASGRLSTPAR
ncbi:MAG: hypothetical protein M3228_12295 [Actinomycetota bacterium]|nr:hypothetical protein [Actinomycetota bacterium]